MAKNKTAVLIDMYKNMSEEALNEEIEAFFEIGYSLLEAIECDSFENFPTTNVKLRFSCEVLNDQSKYYN
jgi:hypothetical protein